MAYDPNSEAGKVIDRCLHELGEHFDAVQIMATKMDEGATMRAIRGTGNWYSRIGMAKEFLDEDIARENANQIADKLNPEEE